MKNNSALLFPDNVTGGVYHAYPNPDHPTEPVWVNGERYSELTRFHQDWWRCDCGKANDYRAGDKCLHCGKNKPK